ncbi:unnamed protein product [Nyctereutes procyonoides]|uniref:(raccoon dog) hypothetical protein n=1 Tax=Nyctereutes procyonoides TaxID=34880 RepID=A0A811ZZM3_NYCPR|nr:unnamed protein product [Nyctereutes procyonoides]
MAAPTVKAEGGWPTLALNLRSAVLWLPGLTQDPRIDQEYYRKPLAELTEEENKLTNVMLKGGNKVLPRSLLMQTLEAVKGKQFEEYPAASAEEQATIEGNPYAGWSHPRGGGGHFYPVPVPLAHRRRCFLAMRWMIKECREKQHRRMLMPEKLSHEPLEKKRDMHKMAQASRALALPLVVEAPHCKK